MRSQIKQLFHVLIPSVVLLLSGLAEAATRVALVIGNGNYEHANVLPNPANDAADVDAALTHAGFSVTRLVHANKDKMEKALAAFAARAANSDMAVLFFAGHGMELGGVNYLIPVDATLDYEVTAPLQTLKLPDVMDVVGTSRLGIVFLDACRDNPLVNKMVRRNGDRTAYRGLARIEPLGNLQVVFAARDGSRAQDGKGRNSPFTSALLEGLRTPGIELRELWGDVRERVLADTGQQQEPYIYGPPLGRTKYYFLQPPKEIGNSPPVVDGDRLSYEAALSSGSPQGWQAYLQRYPNGAYAGVAEVQLAALSRPPPAPEPSSAPTPTPAPAPFVSDTKDCEDCPEMVRIPGGTFRMGDLSGEGSSDEKPAHEVTIRPFWAGKYEVTFAEWDACVAAGGCSHQPDDRSWGRGRRPVMNVSWNDAQEYVRWLSQTTDRRYRLLSEAEWEYAARAGTSTNYSLGDTITCSQARYGRWGAHCGFVLGAFGAKTVPVGSFAANSWGLHDVHGNVTEWVQDCWSKNYEGAPMDGSAWISGNCTERVHRGGGWSHAAGGVVSAQREKEDAAVRYDSRGLRVGRD